VIPRIFFTFDHPGIPGIRMVVEKEVSGLRVKLKLKITITIKIKCHFTINAKVIIAVII